MGQSFEGADSARVHFGEAQNQENYGTDMNYHRHCHCAVYTIPKIGDKRQALVTGVLIWAKFQRLVQEKRIFYGDCRGFNRAFKLWELLVGCF